MRTVYKVTVEANVYDDNGDFVRAEVLFDMSSPRAAALLRSAPVEVEDALRDLLPDDEDEVDAPAAGEPITSAVGAALTALAQPAAPKTRKRRTKAEIAADKAAEAAKALPAAPVPAPEPTPPAEPVPAPTPVQPAPPVPAPAPVPAEQNGSGAVVAGPPAEAVPATAAPASSGEAPWNPFQTR